MRIFWKIVKYLLLALIVLATAFFAIIQLPSVQTAATAKATQILEDYFDAEISVGSVSLKPFTTLVVHDLNVVDKAPYNAEAKDTLLHVGRMGATFSLMSLVGPGHEDFILKRVKLQDTDFNLVIEGGELYSTNLTRMFRISQDKPKKKAKEKDIFNIQHLVGENISYTMQNFSCKKSAKPNGAICWEDMHVYQANIKASDFRMSAGRFYADVQHIDFKEKSGWEVTHLEASTDSGQGDAKIYNIRIMDSTGSTADFDYEMIGTTQDFKDYVNRVVMVADVRDSRMSLSTLSRFIPPFNGDPNTFIDIKGSMRGTVSDLRTEGIDLKVVNSNVGTHYSGRVANLPDVENMYFDARMNGTTFSTAKLTKFLHSIAPKTKELDLSNIGSGKLFNADLKVNGPINDMALQMNIKQGRSGGLVDLEANVKDVLSKGKRPIAMQGELSTEILDLGTLLGLEKFGPTTLSTAFNATMPFQGEELKASLKDLEIKELFFNDYRYHSIGGEGTMHGKDIDASLHSADPNCDVDLTVWSEKYAYNAAANIRNADLNALHLDKRDTSQVSLNAYAHLDRDLTVLQGNASLTDIFVTNSEDSYHIGDMTLTAEKQDDMYDIALDGSELSANFFGNKKQIDARFTTYNSSSLLAYLLPGAYLDHGTHAEVVLHEDGSIIGEVNSHRIAYKDNYIKDLKCKLSGDLKDMDATIEADEIQAGNILLSNNFVNICYVDSVARVNYGFHNDDELSTYGDINIDATLGAHKRFAFDIKPSEVAVGGERWIIPQSFAQIQGKEIEVDNFSIRNENSDQWLSVHGKMSAKDSEVLKAVVNKLDISMFNTFIKKFDLGLEGCVDADGCIISPVVAGIPKIELHLQGENLKAGDCDLGRFTAACEYDSLLEQFDISANDVIDGKDAILANAVLRPSDMNLNANIILDAFPFGFAQRFIPSVFSEMHGKLSGSYNLDGPLKKLNFSSKDGRVDDAGLTVDYTRVPYTMAGTLHMDNEGIHIDDVLCHDRYNGSAVASGGVKWDRGRNLVMDISLDAENAESVNIPSDVPGFFWGHIFGTGTVDFKGPFKGIVMGINVHSALNSDIHFNLSGGSNATKTDLLTFVDQRKKKTDPYEAHITSMRKKAQGQSEFKMKLHAVVDPSFTVYLDLGSDQFSSGLQGVGNGTVDMDLNTTTADYSILGEFILSEGKVDVNASNIVRRIFQIQSGSSIRFQGDILDSILDIDADYETKASISSLIADDEGVSQRRSVLCGINIQNQLRNPDIKFSINIPDLNPSIQASVESALSTDDKVQKQFLSLLLSNNFLPDETSGIVNNSSLLYSNVSEIMANQVNNILSKLDIPLDLGLNYQPTEQGNNLFDVALSTQLFNNRVIIGGNFGNRQNLTTTNDSFFGDLDIQYKVTRNGAFRIKAFSHSADKYSNFLDNSQRNGVGMSWQQEFNTFPEWFKRLFSSKAKREALKQMDATGIQKQTTIILDE